MTNLKNSGLLIGKTISDIHRRATSSGEVIEILMSGGDAYCIDKEEVFEYKEIIP